MNPKPRFPLRDSIAGKLVAYADTPGVPIGKVVSIHQDAVEGYVVLDNTRMVPVGLLVEYDETRVNDDLLAIAVQELRAIEGDEAYDLADAVETAAHELEHLRRENQELKDEEEMAGASYTMLAHSHAALLKEACDTDETVYKLREDLKVAQDEIRVLDAYLGEARMELENGKEVSKINEEALRRCGDELRHQRIVSSDTKIKLANKDRLYEELRAEYQELVEKIARDF